MPEFGPETIGLTSVDRQNSTVQVRIEEKNTDEYVRLQHSVFIDENGEIVGPVANPDLYLF
ncbi:hypothetical protein GCM10028816_09600 [Spirosoma lituiforme]